MVAAPSVVDSGQFDGLPQLNDGSFRFFILTMTYCTLTNYAVPLLDVWAVKYAFHSQSVGTKKNETGASMFTLFKLLI